jgi:TPR repeat protein
MISTKKQFHPLGENQRQLNLSLTNQTLCVLGVMYEKGRGVKQDDFKALKFYQKACDLNYGSGCFNLGLSSFCMKTTRAKKEQGVKLGRPKGTRKSKLDKFKPEIGSLFF